MAETGNFLFFMSLSIYSSEWWDILSLVLKTRPNEFGSMTTRKGDIKPQNYKEQDHIRPHNAIYDYTRLYKATLTYTRQFIEFNTMMWHRR